MISTEVRDVLAAVKKTSGLRARIHKELGLDKLITSSIQPNDMYFYEYKKPELESKGYLILHGKCIDAGQKQYLDNGYEFIQTRHITKSTTELTGTRCAHCKERLDEKVYLKYKAEQQLRQAKRYAEQLEEKAIREEWEAEQILLGKM